MLIIKNELPELSEIFKTQKLVDIFILLEPKRLNKITKSDEIDSKYIISVVCENYFKNMMDEYLNKIILNG